MFQRLALISVVLLFALAGCATNPVSGKKEAAFMSEEKEIEIGRKVDSEIRKQYGVYDDPELQAYVQQIGEKLAGLSHRPELFYRFTVLDSPDVNAFALPGGYIYITRGILTYLNSEAELAAVLGHEVGHVTARHAVKQYTTATAARLGYILGSIFVPELAGQGVASLVSTLNAAILSGYGRKYELQSDELGAQYLALAGYDPQAMIEVLEILKTQEEFELERAKLEGREPRVYHGLFATHPSNDQRLQEIIDDARELKTPNPRVGRGEFLEHLDGVVFGDSVKEGVRYGNKFYHKDLGFALEVPANWRIENRPNELVAVSRNNEGVLRVILEDINRRVTPREFMLKRLKLKDLSKDAPLNIKGLQGYTAIARVTWSFGRRDTRVSVIFFGDKAYIFYGTGKTDAAFSAADPKFLSSARSFHALTATEQKLAEGLRIEIVTASAGTTFAGLAKGSPVPNYPTRILRIINDKYPSGEPTPGQKLKVIR